MVLASQSTTCVHAQCFVRPARKSLPSRCAQRCRAGRSLPAQSGSPDAQLPPWPSAASVRDLQRNALAATLLSPLLFPGAATSAADAGAASASATPDNGWLTPIVNSLDFVLANIEQVYLGWGVPYAYGWSIVSLTLFVKIITLPLTKTQVESAMAVQQLKPRVDIIKKRYGEDKEKIQKETSRLYAAANVNPLAGCFPSLLQLPIFFGLFRSLNNFARSGTLDEAGFFWIPSLAGPVPSDGGTGWSTAWLLPFVDGQPPGGWEAAAPYLVLPVLLVLAQIASTAIISPVDPNDENANTQRALLYFLPLTIGWFSLNVPSGLSLYYFSNSIFTSLQQIYFRKLGGVQLDSPDLGPVKQLGMGRRTGEVVVPIKDATALPSFGDATLAAEFGAAVELPTPGSTTTADTGSSAAEPPAPGNAVVEASTKSGSDVQQQPSDAESDIIGGVAVLAAGAEGVATAEIECLNRRCKRTRLTA